MHKALLLLFIAIVAACSSPERDNAPSKADELISEKDSVDQNYDSIVQIEGGNGVEKYKNGDLVYSAFFYPDQTIKYEIIKKDSLIITPAGDSVICKELHITYDQNGAVVEKGCQGEYNGTGMSVGTWYRYHNNKLVQELYYHNDEFGKDYILYKIINDQGEVEEIATNNHGLYQNDSIVLSRAEYLKRKGTKKR